jgi:hypothetical protein
MTTPPGWLPGDNAISGKAIGADAVVARAQKIASYGLSFELLHILVSPTNVALSLNNTARWDGAALDEYLATACFLNNGKIANIETYAPTQDMDAFFV